MTESKNKGPLRAASYTRLSTKRQVEEGLSLDAQQKRVADYIRQQGWRHVESYVERGVSGRKRERPGLDRLLASLDGFDVLVIPRLDRLGRNYAHLTAIKGKLDDAGVALVCLDPQIDFSTSIGLMIWANLTAMAQVESENIAERVSAVSTARALEGRHHGGPRPYGYEHRDGELVMVPDEALIVKRVYESFLAGTSQRRIAQDLNRERVPALKSKWTQSTISRILRVPLYRGAIMLNGTEYAGTHDPIIDADTWQKAVALREGNTRTKLAGRGKPSSRFLLTRGHLRCRCGAAMVVRSDADRYECSARKADVKSCEQRPVKRTLVDGALISYFLTCGLDEEATRAQLQGGVERRLAEVRSLREQAERDEHAATEALARIRRQFKAGEVSPADWSEFRDELTAEKKAAAAEVKRLRRQEQEAAKATELSDCEAKTLSTLAELRATIASEVVEARGLEAVRAALTRLFASFTLMPADAEAPESDAVLDAVDVGTDYLIWTEPRPSVLEGIDADFLPVLKRETLYRQNEHEGLTT